MDGLGQVVLHARIQAALAVAFHGVGGHGDDGQVVEPGFLADGSGGGQAIHFGHLDVHQHQVVVVGRGRLYFCHGIMAVDGGLDLYAGFFQKGQGHGAVELYVIDQQHPGTGDGAEIEAAGRGRWGGAGRAGRAGRAGCGAEQGLAHCRMQGGGADRFGQNMLQAHLRRLGAEFFVAAGGDHQDAGQASAAVGRLDMAGHFNAIHAGHQPIEQHQVVGGAGRIGLLQALQAGWAAVHHIGLDAKLHQRGVQNFTGTGVVIHHQNALAAQRRGGGAAVGGQ